MTSGLNMQSNRFHNGVLSGKSDAHEYDKQTDRQTDGHNYDVIGLRAMGGRTDGRTAEKSFYEQANIAQPTALHNAIIY